MIGRMFKYVISNGSSLETKVPEPGTYVGTIFEGPFVWHVYEVPS